MVRSSMGWGQALVFRLMTGSLGWDQSQVASGYYSLVASYAGSGLYRTTITGPSEAISESDKLFVYARVADCAVPRQIVLRARVGGRWTSAYWGEPLWGVTAESIHMGGVPASGSWARLDILLRDLAGGGDPVVSELELAHVDGQVWLDRIGRMADCVPATAAQPSVPGDEDVLVDDDAPSWVTFENGSNGPMAWTSAQSGSLSLVHPYRGLGTYVTGLANLAQPLVSGSKLSMYALIDACSPPVRQIHLRITTTAGSSARPSSTTKTGVRRPTTNASSAASGGLSRSRVGAAVAASVMPFSSTERPETPNGSDGRWNSHADGHLRGHRLYGREEVVRLQQILSLRQMGFPIVEIRELLARRDFDARGVVLTHIERLRRQIAERQDLCTRLEAIAAHYESATADEFIRAIEVMTMFEKYYTTEQLETLHQRGQMLGEEKMREVQEEWPRLIAAVREEMQRGTDPKDPKVQALARRWMELVEMFTGGDPGGSRRVVESTSRRVAR